MPEPMTASLHTTLELSTEIDRQRTRERCPTIHFLNETGMVVASFPTDIEQPRLALQDASIAHIDLDRTLAHVIDEEAWLRECQRILEPGGEIRFIVPANGPTAWLDARNIYRYIVDVTKHGDEPDATLPTGWGRHYSSDDIGQLLRSANLTATAIQRVGTGLPEIPQVVGLIAGNLIGGHRDTERRLHPLRVRMEKRDDARIVPLLGSSFSVQAIRR